MVFGLSFVFSLYKSLSLFFLVISLANDLWLSCISRKFWLSCPLNVCEPHKEVLFLLIATFHTYDVSPSTNGPCIKKISNSMNEKQVQLAEEVIRDVVICG